MFSREVEWEGFSHVYPEGDVMTHNMDFINSPGCKCDPYVDFNYRLIIHDALDGRPGDIIPGTTILVEIVPPKDVKRYGEIFKDEE